MRELLRQAEEQLQASRQQAALLAAELREAAGARDHSMGELYQARLEAERLAASLAEAQAEGRRLESRLERLRSAAAARKDVVSGVAAAPPGGHCSCSCIAIIAFLHHPALTATVLPPPRAWLQSARGRGRRRRRRSCSGRWRS